MNQNSTQKLRNSENQKLRNLETQKLNKYYGIKRNES